MGVSLGIMMDGGNQAGITTKLFKRGRSLAGWVFEVKDEGKERKDGERRKDGTMEGGRE